jgi:hypothetical protein
LARVVTDHPTLVEPASSNERRQEMNTTTNQRRLELAYRSSAGIDVTLVWNQQTDELTVTAFDTSTGQLLELDARRERAPSTQPQPGRGM